MRSVLLFFICIFLFPFSSSSSSSSPAHMALVSSDSLDDNKSGPTLIVAGNVNKLANGHGAGTSAGGGGSAGGTPDTSNGGGGGAVVPVIVAGAANNNQHHRKGAAATCNSHIYWSGLVTLASLPFLLT
ncbi:hypothetical protein LINPERPRIM_LOCUS23690 [Linum perenne]